MRGKTIAARQQELQGEAERLRAVVGGKLLQRAKAKDGSMLTGGAAVVLKRPWFSSGGRSRPTLRAVGLLRTCGRK
jgi:hypothetical protein